MIVDTSTAVSAKRPWWRILYMQVLVGVILGVAIGSFLHGYGSADKEHLDRAKDILDIFKSLSTLFIKLIRMLVAPIIFCTVVTGIAAMDNVSTAGKVGSKAILYFLFMTVFSLAIGLLIANTVHPGAGMHVDPKTLSTAGLKIPPASEGGGGFMEFVMHVVPDTAVGAFAGGEILQVLFFSLLFAASTVFIGERVKPMIAMIEQLSHVLFGIVGIVMKLAPIGAFGAMAFTVGKYGFAALGPLALLLLCFYATCILFVVLVVGLILRYSGLSFWRYLDYIKEEILVVFGTCSSETVFPRMIEKLTNLGIDKSVVGMVLPTGYSFNLVGSSIYLTLAAVFLAQATDTPLDFAQQLSLIGVMMLTSKGAAGVVGTAFVALTSTLASFEPSLHIPVASAAIILGVDSFMAQGRSVTNLISNGAATILMAKWEGQLDLERAREVLAGRILPELESSSEIGTQAV